MKKNIILFGAGQDGQEAFNEYSAGHKVRCFVDNNTSIQGTMILDTPVIGAKDIWEYLDSDTDIVIATAWHYKEIVQQLETMGICDYYIYIYNTLFNKLGQYEKIMQCSRCVMDNIGDDDIFFSVDKGECNYCVSSINQVGKIYFPNDEGRLKLESLIKKIKEDGKDKKYDCIMGLSGGLDSSYLTYMGYKWGLRILVLHIDDGFDTEISKSNIKKLIEKTGFDYEVIIPDEIQCRDLTLAYMKAGVPNIAVPQDNLMMGEIYHKMREYNIKYFLSGGNFALECILQKSKTYDNLDVNNIKNIHDKFGEGSIDKLHFISRKEVEEFKRKFGIESLRPLNYIDYNKKRAFKELYDFCGFQYYGRKHLENIFTAFVQLYWFPHKFGVDKRKSHLSSMIVSGQMSRDEALQEMKEPLYREEEMQEYIDYIKCKLNISREDFDELLNGEPHMHEEYN